MWSDHFQQIHAAHSGSRKDGYRDPWANYPNQLEGCLALGTTEEMTENAIDQSKSAWINFVQMALTDQPSITIKFVEDYGTTEVA